MIRISNRVFLGCVAGALSILVFHQMTLQIFYWLGWAAHPAFRIAHVPPFNAPLVASITFWGAVYGGVFGSLSSSTKGPLWLLGMIAGLCAMMLSWFVFLPLMGHPMAFGWEVGPMLRSFTAYQMWGLGLSLVFPLLFPRSIVRRSGNWQRHNVAA
jgi:ABC-type uncharacterized transport system permease subunit